MAGAAALAWKDTRRKSEIQTAITMIAQKRSRLDAEIREREQWLATADGNRVRLQSERDGLLKAKATPTTPVEAKKTATAPTSSALMAQALQQFENDQKDPKIQVSQLASRRSKVRSTYELLFRTLGLSPAQIEKFQEIAARLEAQKMDLNAILGEEVKANQVISEGTWSAVKKLQAKADADYQSAQRELLGETGYRQLQDYERTSPVRTMVSGLAGTAVLAGLPISAQQAERLTQVLANASSEYQQGRTASLATVDWNLVDAQASDILTESQLSLFKTAEPAEGGRYGSLYSTALSNAMKADFDRKRVEATRRAGGG